MLTALITIYFLIGFIYAIYLLSVGSSSIAQFPINMIGGPIFIIYILYKKFKGERLPIE